MTGLLTHGNVTGERLCYALNHSALLKVALLNEQWCPKLDREWAARGRSGCLVNRGIQEAPE